MAYPSLGNSDHVIVSVSNDLPSDSKGDVPFLSHSLWLFLWWFGRSSRSSEKSSMGGHLGASAAATEFCDWVQFQIDVYIPHRKYQIKPHQKLGSRDFGQQRYVICNTSSI